ncbi:hypothetical protein AAFN47_18855 [Hoeflea sp. CAU 1731]
MTRLVNHSEMTPEEIINCSHTAMALVQLCANGTQDMQSIQGDQTSDQLGANLSLALHAAYHFMERVHDHLETRQARDGNGVIKQVA